MGGEAEAEAKNHAKDDSEGEAEARADGNKAATSKEKPPIAPTLLCALNAMNSSKLAIGSVTKKGGSTLHPCRPIFFLRHGGPPPRKHIHCSHCEVPRRTAAMYISQCFI